MISQLSLLELEIRTYLFTDFSINLLKSKVEDLKKWKWILVKSFHRINLEISLDSGLRKATVIFWKNLWTLFFFMLFPKNSLDALNRELDDIALGSDFLRVCRPWIPFF